MVLLLLGISVYGSYLAIKINRPLKPSETLKPMVIGGLNVVEYGKDGKVSRVFKTATLTHYKNQKQSKMVKPDITLYQEDNVWHIISDNGTSYNNNSKVYLTGHVKIHQVATDKKQLVETDSLWYYPNKHFAESSAVVKYMRDETLIVNAKGMKANLDTKHIELLSQVSARYVDIKTSKKDEAAKSQSPKKTV